MKTKFLTPTEHGTYWRNLAQRRIVKLRETEQKLSVARAALRKYQRLYEVVRDENTRFLRENP